MLVFVSDETAPQNPQFFAIFKGGRDEQHSRRASKNDKHGVKVLFCFLLFRLLEQKGVLCDKSRILSEKSKGETNVTYRVLASAAVR